MRRIITKQEHMEIILSTNLRHHPRIIGGDNAFIRFHPWQVHTTVRGQPFCGGIIIAPNFILTARHCFAIADSLRFTANEVRVHAGITCRSEINSNNTFEVYRIIPHPIHSRDAALIQLFRPIPFNETRHPVNFMASTNNAFLSPGNRVTASGWGCIVHQGSMVECLQAVDLVIVRTSTHIITTTRTANFHQGLCPGDSGGPLTIRTASNEPILIGIAEAIGGPYSWFERVDQIVPWIKGYVRPVIPTISGPQTICVGSTGIFTLGNVPAGAHITWFHSPNLQRASSSGNSATFSTTATTGNGWVEARVNGIPTRRVDVAIGRPVIHSIQGPPEVNLGSSLFAVNCSGGTLTWSVSPSVGVTINTTADDAVRYIHFTHPGNYTITATSTNECGSSTRHLNIRVTTANVGLPPFTFACPLCGFYPLRYGMACPCVISIRVSEEEEEEEEQQQQQQTITPHEQ